MRLALRIGVALATLFAVFLQSGSAEARCTRLAFSVNDYGKDGPIRDAKQLLDKYIQEWTAKQGIKQYTVGKKDVSCELFLDLLVFDEHTCKASALVCWGGSGPAKGAQPAKASPDGAAASAPPAKARPPAPPPAAAKAQPPAPTAEPAKK